MSCVVLTTLCIREGLKGATLTWQDHVDYSKNLQPRHLIVFFLLLHPRNGGKAFKY